MWILRPQALCLQQGGLTSLLFGNDAEGVISSFATLENCRFANWLNDERLVSVRRGGKVADAEVFLESRLI